MKFKNKIFIISLILIFLLSISFASAHDEELISDDEIGVLASTDDEVLIDSAKDAVQTESVKEKILGSNESEAPTTDERSYTNLQDSINKAEPGITLALNHDYAYHSGDVPHISITQTTTIDGKGHYISGMAEKGIFRFDDAEDGIKLTLRNLVFKDARSDNGAVIHTKKNVDITIINCTFIGNEAIEDGGAIYFDSTGTLDIRNSTFEKCLVRIVEEGYTKHNGGAINTHDGILKIDGCTFRNNTAGFGYGGAIYLQGECSGITNSVFENNLALSRFGGAIYVENVNKNGLAIDNCSFTNNTGKAFDKKRTAGGAIYYEGKGLVRLTNSNFTRNILYGVVNGNKDAWEGSRTTDTILGGAVASLHDIEIGNCIFRDNHAVEKGGAVYTDEGIRWILGPSVFINNSAGHANIHLANKGGAIYAGKFLNEAKGLVFIANSAWYGGAIYIHNKNELTFDSCVFRNNSVWNTDGKKTCGAAVYIDSASSKLHLTNNVIVDNYATDDKGFYNCGSYGTIEHNWFGTNHPNFDDAYLVEWHRIGSNDKRSDSNYLQLRLESDTNWVYNSDATLTAYFVDCKGNNFTGSLTNWDATFFSDVEADEFTSAIIGENTATADVFVHNQPKHLISVKVDNQVESLTINEKGNFTWLQEQINASNGVFNLTCDLSYSIDVDQLFKGVFIGKEITINGNGHTLDARGQSRIFDIHWSNVKINNITFINGREGISGGGAIFIDGVENVTISDSIFKDNHASCYGGAIYSRNGKQIEILNSQFINNYESDYGGGAILISSPESIIKDCLFLNNQADQGGAIDIREDNITIDGCEFRNNTARSLNNGGGAINNFGNNITIKNSIFLDNKAQSYWMNYETNGTTLILSLEGMENYMNAINSGSEINFSNVTYWNGNITTGDNPIHSSNASGVNFTVNVFDSEGKVIKEVKLQSDANGEAKYNFSTLESGNYTFNAYHAEDSYYTEYFTKGEFSLKRIVVIPSSVNIWTENKKEFVYGRINIEFSIENKTECNIVITNENSSEVLYDYMTENGYFNRDLYPRDEYYNITVYNVGNETVAPSKDSILFKVLKADSEVNIESLPSEIAYSTDASVHFKGQIDCHDYNVTIYDENNETVYSEIVWVAQTFGSMQIPTLNVGNYSIIVTNLGNNYTGQNSASGKFTVVKVNNHFEVLVDDGVYGENTTVTVNADLDGEYLVSINSLNVTIDVVNGTGSKSVELPAGSYEAMVSFNSENSDNFATNDTFNVSKAKSNVDAKILENITYGTDNVIYLLDDFPADYNVIIYNEGYEVVFNETFSSNNFTLPNLTVGTYNLTVINLGNENIEGFTDSQIFSITRDNNVFVYAESTDYGREVLIAIEADVDGFYTVDINGTELTIEVINGSGAYYDYLDLDAGDYYANASFDHPDYDNIIENATFTINVAESTLEIMEIGNVTYGENVPIEFYDEYPTIFEVLIIDENGTVIMNSTTTLMYFELGDLELGEYYVLVKNLGDDNVIGDEDYISFNVVEDSEELDDTPISVAVFAEGNNVIIVASVDEEATGDIEFNINGSSVYVPLDNGIAVLSTFLPQGEYTVNASYSGDDYFNSNSSSESFNVTDPVKKDAEISPEAVVNDYDVTLIVAVGDNATGFVQMGLDNKTYYAHIDEGKAIFEIEMDAGNYTADFIYLGDDSFNKVEASLNFTVNDVELKDPSLTLKANAVDNFVNVLVSIDPEATGYVLLSINDYDVFFVLNGSGIIIYDTLMAPGNYSINAIYLGDDKFNIDNDATDLTVSAPVKDNSTMDINLVNGTVVISVVDGDNNPIENASVIVSINGNETKMATDSNGLISLPVTGNATVNAVYNKADKSNITSSLKVFENNETAIKEINNTVIEYVNNTIIEYVNTTVEVPVYINNTVEVPIIRNATQIICKNMTTTAITRTADRNGEYFTFTLKDGNGKILANKPVAIGFNGKVYNRTTDESGQAKLQVNLKAAGGYTFAISFLGDDYYNASFAVAKITVNKQKASLTVPNKSYKATAKTKSLTATFKDSKGKAVSGKKITFTVNGKTYSAKTNSKGVATVKVSLSTKKTYSFTAKYAGDNTFLAVTKKAKFVIK